MENPSERIKKSWNNAGMAAKGHVHDLRRSFAARQAGTGIGR